MELSIVVALALELTASTTHAVEPDPCEPLSRTSSITDLVREALTLLEAGGRFPRDYSMRLLRGFSRSDAAEPVPIELDKRIVFVPLDRDRAYRLAFDPARPCGFVWDGVTLENNERQRAEIDRARAALARVRGSRDEELSLVRVFERGSSLGFVFRSAAGDNVSITLDAVP
ncbi:MAG: hypothetical protein GY716_22380 [bacterium]|nr:hypothetical protein [bacterium]